MAILVTFTVLYIFLFSLIIIRTIFILMDFIGGLGSPLRKRQANQAKRGVQKQKSKYFHQSFS